MSAHAGVPAGGARRQIVLDTETTGLEVASGHRMIEIGCVEMTDRRLTGNNFHHYLQPDRKVDPGAAEVHGITDDKLVGMPRFPEIVDALVAYLDGAELLIHNATFDVGFIEMELERAGRPVKLDELCTVTDTLAMARKQFPGQRNTLDALCRRLEVSNAHRTLHGALLDSEILADVYLRMTGGQGALRLDAGAGDGADRHRIDVDHATLVLVEADAEACAAHEAWMKRLDEGGAGNAWREHAES